MRLGELLDLGDWASHDITIANIKPQFAVLGCLGRGTLSIASIQCDTDAN